MFCFDETSLNLKEKVGESHCFQLLCHCCALWGPNSFPLYPTIGPIHCVCSKTQNVCVCVCRRQTFL